ncbi:MAG: hypothetical protein WC959_12410 [Kiritimatiellales bacterium]
MERKDIPDGILRTSTGLLIDVFNPDPDCILIEDIAHALSNLCRFGGHTPRFYSVAEHSIRCANLVPGRRRTLEALLHDASEAYLVDVPSPIKKFLPEYKKIEDNLMKAISLKFGFQYPVSKIVELADKAMLEIEWQSLMVDNSWITMPQEYARNTFLDYYNFLTK